jgi:hypothetical protein
VDWVAGTAMVIRREVWDRVGPFDTGYRFYCQDLDLCSAAAAEGWGVRILPDFRIFHLHGGTISEESGSVGAQNPELMWTDLLRFANKHQGRDGARSSIRALRMGGTLRIVGRSLASPLVGHEKRNRWREATLAYADALKALSRFHEGERSGAP